jgi:hypothetical protein
MERNFCNYWQRIKIRSEGLFYEKSLCLENNPDATK